MNALTQRVFTEVVRKPFLRALMFPYLAILLLVYLADANVDWLRSRREIALLTPGAKTLLFALLISGWSLIAGRALRPVWAQRSISFLLRQPLTAWQWTRALLPSLAMTLAPVLALWWLAAEGREPLIHYAGFLGLPLTLVVGASFRGRSSLLVMGAGAAAIVLLMLAYWNFPLAGILGLPAAPLLLRFAMGHLRTQAGLAQARRTSLLVSASPVGALLLRDLRAVTRSRGGAFSGLAVVGTLMALLMLACRVNGEVRGEDALQIACVLFLIAGSGAYRNLEALRTRLGAALLRPEWPVTYEQRALSLMLLTGVFMAPAAVTLAVLGSSMGALYLLQFCLFAAAVMASCAALFASSLRASASKVAVFMNLQLVQGVLILALPTVASLGASLLIILFSRHLVARGLRAFVLANQGTQTP